MRELMPVIDPESKSSPIISDRGGVLRAAAVLAIASATIWRWASAVRISLVVVTLSPALLLATFFSRQLPFAQADRREPEIARAGLDEMARNRMLDKNPRHVSGVILDQQIPRVPADLGRQGVRPIGEIMNPDAVRSQLPIGVGKERHPESHSVFWHSQRRRQPRARRHTAIGGRRSALCIS